LVRITKILALCGSECVEHRTGLGDVIALEKRPVKEERLATGSLMIHEANRLRQAD
jgi:pantoate kinase